MSYSAASQPLYPTLAPNDVYKRLFAAEIMAGGLSEANLAALRRQRARKQSVLDFITWDLQRAQQQFPLDFKADLDAHATAVREVETALDADLKAAETQGATCTAPTIDTAAKGGGDHANMAKVGAQHFKVLLGAFKCDLTRVATFQWATGASRVSFSPLGTNNHHSTSHANQRGVLSGVDKWFSEQTVPFIRDLIATADVGGAKMIDNTLVWYINEIAEGWNHSFNGYPFVFFGGDGVGLKKRNRVLNVSGKGFTSNDVWTSLAPSFGTTLTTFGTKSTGAIPDLFSV